MGGALALLVLMAFGGSGKGATGGGSTGGGTGGGTNGNGLKKGTAGVPKTAVPGVVGGVARQPGNPPSSGNRCNSSGCCYNRYRWSPYTTDAALVSLGYPSTPLIFGADGILGTEDAIPSPGVLAFQREYNLASSRAILPMAGGLNMDGKVGGCTLAGLAHVLDVFGAGLAWRAAVGALQG